MAISILREYIVEGRIVQNQAEERIREALEAATNLAWALSG